MPSSRISNASIWFTKRFQLWMICGFLAGIVLSSVLQTWRELVGILVAGIIFSSFATRPHGGISTHSLRKHLGIWFVQKCVVPITLFFMLRPFELELALAVLLIAQLPAAGMVPTLVGLTGGNVSLALRLLMIESILACVGIPCLFLIVTWGEAQISPWAIGQYLFGVLMVPVLLSEGMRWFAGPDTLRRFRDLAGAVSVGCLTLLVAIIAATVKPQLLESPRQSLIAIAIAFVLAPVLASIGVFTGQARTQEGTVTFGLKNMYLNIGLGLGLASSYFGGQSSLMVLSYMVPINLLPHLVAHAIRQAHR